MVKLSGALVALLICASPASAGDAFDRAVVAMTSLGVCPDPIFSDRDAIGLMAIAAMVSRADPVRVMIDVAAASSFTVDQITRRGTSFPFCTEARRLAAAMPRT